MIQIEIACKVATSEQEQQRLKEAVRAILTDAGLHRAEISLAIVDDPTIHDLNRQYLQHDYATDVLSFVLSREEDSQARVSLDGEVIASRDTAARVAISYGWPAADELLLYVIHGTLHLVGYEDQTPEGAAEMRSCEARYLKRLGITPAIETGRESVEDIAVETVSSNIDSGERLSPGEPIK